MAEREREREHEKKKRMREREREKREVLENRSQPATGRDGAKKEPS